MEFDLKLDYHTKISSAAAQGPEQVGILIARGMHKRTVCRDRGEACNVVTGKSMQASEPSGAAAQHQPGSAGVGDHAGRKHQSCALGRDVDGAKKTPTGKARPARVSVDGDFAHRRQINHYAALASAETSKTVPAASE